MEKEKAAEATKTVDAEWKELQMLMSALKVHDRLAPSDFCLYWHQFIES